MPIKMANFFIFEIKTKIWRGYGERNWNPYVLLARIQNGTAAVENSMAVLLEVQQAPPGAQWLCISQLMN